MTDVEIKYNNATIASLSDSGTEVLETNGTYLTDDIMVEYTKQSAASNIVYIDYDYAEDGNTKTYTLKKTGREIENIFMAGNIVFIKEPNDNYRMMLGWYQESSYIRIYYSNYYTLAGTSSITYSRYSTTSLNYRPTYQYINGGGSND